MICDSPLLAEELVSSALDSLKHRGPDNCGLKVLADQPCILGHTRLAILDLGETAAQPMSSEEERFWITFNGEIYNFHELRERLRSEGVVFSSTGDTEVLLKSCVTWGVDKTLQIIHGMFAFALVDQMRGTVILARDRFGEKPLYFRITDGSLTFGSEIRSLHHPNITRVIDKTSIAEYLKFQYCPSPRTGLEDIESVPAGHYLEVPISNYIERVDIKDVCYFDPVSVALQARKHRFRGSLAEASLEFLSLFDDIIGRQMLSDVPLGAFLSGGVDSTLVAASMAKVHSGQVETFSIGFADSGFDESFVSREVAGFLGTRHTEFVVTESDALSVIPLLPEVALSGDGGDELFGGYNRYFLGSTAWRYLSKIPKPLRASSSDLLGRVSSKQLDRLGRAISFDGRRIFDGHLAARKTKMMALLDSDQISDLYDGVVSHCITEVDGATPNARWLSPLPAAFEPAEKMMLWDIQSYLCGDILTKVDRAAMANSLETRVPFLDPTLFEFAWSLPLDFKISGRKGKIILKEALSQRVPRDLWDRPKRGFAVPLASWLRNGLKDWAEDLLFESSPYTRLFDNLRLKLMWAEHQSEQANHQDILWSVLMLKMWLNHWTPTIQSR
jgi:asparagine synthase (glutamine-hydrolysing)